MRLVDRLYRLIDGMPDKAAIILSVEQIREWVDACGKGFETDMTVGEVAERFARSPITVRSWIRDGRLRAYRMRGREYRITQSALMC